MLLNSICNNLIIPDWISSNFYCFNSTPPLKNSINNTECSYRVYIRNEKTKQIISFEGNAAKLWNILSSSKKNLTRNVNKFLKENNIPYSDFKLYINELENLNLLFTDTKNIKNEIVQTNDKNDDLKENEYQWISKHNYLPSLFIELTYKCNEKCIHCLNNKDDLISEISLEEMKKITDSAVKIGVSDITLSGGECTCAKDFLKIARYIRKKRLSLTIYTNCQKLYDDKDFFNQFLKLYPKKVEVSLYDIDPKIHDKITGIKGSHKKTVFVIKKLIENNTDVKIKCFQLKENKNSWKKVEKFAKEIGAEFSTDVNFFNNPNRKNSNVRLPESNIIKFFTYKKNQELAPNNKFSSDFLNEKICLAGIYGLAINPNLDVYNCVTLQIPIGNLKKTSLLKLWKNRSKNKIYNYLTNLKRKDLKDCYKASYCRYCDYCPGRAYMNKEFLDKCSISCEIAKATEIALNKSAIT